MRFSPLLLLLGCQPDSPGDGVVDPPVGDTDEGDDSGDVQPTDDTGLDIPRWVDPITAGDTMDLGVPGPELTDGLLAGDVLLFSGQEQSMNGGVWAFDLADPDAPQLIGRTDTWHVQRLCWNGEVALGITRGGEVVHVELTETGPEITATWTTAPSGAGISCEGSTVAMALDGHGTRVTSLEDGPALGDVHILDGIGRDVLLEGNSLWALGPDELGLWDLSGSYPELVSSVALAGSCTDLAAHEDWLAVACGSAGVAFVDRGESAPEVLGWWTGHASARAVDVSEDHVFVAAWAELLLVDASDPSAPWLRGSEPARSAVMAVVAGEEQRAWVGDWNQPFPVSWTRERAPELRASATTALPGSTVWITNDGPEELRFGPPDGGELAADRLAPGERTSWTMPETATGSLQVGTNDPDEPSLVVELSDAEGLSVGAEAPDFLEVDLDGTAWELSKLHGEVVFLGLFNDG